MRNLRPVDGFVEVRTTFESRDEALSLIRLAVERRLAACGQVIGPIQSVYRWRGGVEDASEWLCLLKTRRELSDALTTVIEAEHSYEVPEVVVFPVEGTSAAYGEWIDEETSG
jgi:periplasmic divalent cation tolerance protein